MKESQLKKAVADMNIKDDMIKRLIDNCSVGHQKRRLTKMKKINRTVLIAAALAVLILGFTTITYGQAIYEKIREIVLGGHAHYVDIDYNAYYEAEINTEEETFIFDGEEEGSITTLTDISKAKAYLAFDLKLPAYLPEGYVFDRIELYNDENGQPDGQYASVYFTKGKKYIYLQARLMNENTSFATDLGRLKEIEIDGHKGLIDKNGLNIDLDGVMYMFSSGFADVDSNELIKMVEACK